MDINQKDLLDQFNGNINIPEFYYKFQGRPNIEGVTK